MRIRYAFPLACGLAAAFALLAIPPWEDSFSVEGSHTVKPARREPILRSRGLAPILGAGHAPVWSPPQPLGWSERMRESWEDGRARTSSTVAPAESAPGPIRPGARREPSPPPSGEPAEPVPAPVRQFGASGGMSQAEIAALVAAADRRTEPTEPPAVADWVRPQYGVRIDVARLAVELLAVAALTGGPLLLIAAASHNPRSTA